MWQAPPASTHSAAPFGDDEELQAATAMSNRRIRFGMRGRTATLPALAMEGQTVQRGGRIAVRGRAGTSAMDWRKDGLDLAVKVFAIVGGLSGPGPWP